MRDAGAWRCSASVTLLGQVLLMIMLAACNEVKEDFVTLQGEAQGTTFTITYRDSAGTDLSQKVDSVLRMIDNSLSLWVDASTVSEFNHSDSLVTSDPHFQRVLACSRQMWELTSGAFDPTVHPLISAYGLGHEGETDLDEQKMTAARELVGLEKISSDHALMMYSSHYPPAVTYWKELPQVSFDPNGIAQGYTVDVLAALLDRFGLNDFMVEVGGEVMVKGNNPDGIPWRLQIDKPVDGNEHHQQAVVDLKDAGMATSGNYRKFREVDGKRYGHTIDPRSGKPVDHGLLSATVIAADATTADALATAFMVMGEEKARKWLESHPEIEAYLIMDDEKGGLRTWATSGVALN